MGVRNKGDGEFRMTYRASRSLVASYIEIRGYRRKSRFREEMMISDWACSVFRNPYDVCVELNCKEVDPWVWNLGGKCRWRAGVGAPEKSGHGHYQWRRPSWDSVCSEKCMGQGQSLGSASIHAQEEDESWRGQRTDSQGGKM